MNNSALLEAAVLTGTPEEAAALCKKLEEGENSCRALALACRYLGLDYVKALVTSGATFKYTRLDVQGGYFTLFYWLAPLEMTDALRAGFFINRTDKCFDNSITLTDVRSGDVKAYQTLPIEKRVEIVRYLCENKERVLLDIDELLYYSIMTRSDEITAVLKEFGAKFTEKRAKALSEGGRGFDWQEFVYMSERLSDEDYLPVMRGLLAELDGKKLNYTDTIYWANYNVLHDRTRLFKPEFFRFILDNFNQKKMSKAGLMRGAINANSVECLAICAENGWLKMPRKRDEMIEFATKENKPECTAFLLEYKNKNFNLAEERVKADKKIERELNAAPDSVSEMKKIWSYKKRENGGLIITSYKGTRGEIVVPEKIGKSNVVEIGEYAFSPAASRISMEQKDFRRKEITRVTLPKTITKIGNEAFSSCEALEEINFPEGLVEIGEAAFASCRKLTEISLPDSVRTITKAFAGCLALRSVRLSEGLSEISDYAFTNCRALAEIRLPAGIQSVGVWAFARCAELVEVVIPDGVTEIKKQAFMECAKLERVVIPASVKSMKNSTYRTRPPESVFHNSPNVTAIVEKGSYAEKYFIKNGIVYHHSN